MLRHQFLPIVIHQDQEVAGRIQGDEALGQVVIQPLALLASWLMLGAAGTGEGVAHGDGWGLVTVPWH
jgi:hypothetical protein